MNTSIPKIEVLGVGVTNASKSEILEYIINFVEKKTGKLAIVTPNPEFVVFAAKNNTFKNILNQAQISLCDGIGLLWASRILGKPIKERTTGVDLLDLLCREAVKKPITVGFVGARPGVAERTAECLTKKYPNLKVAFAFGGEPDWETVESIKYKVLSIGEKAQKTNLLKNGQKPESKDIKEQQVIDILFVAFGFPQQEEWVSKYLDKLPVRVAISVGGAFDYISGEVPRAPKFLRDLGLEWFFRLARQPWRIKRQLALFKFFLLVVREKFFPTSKTSLFKI